MIERHFNVPFVASLALREKQIQQNYRPVIAVHKWFARRPGTLFRSLILSEFIDKPVFETFYKANDLPGVRIFDPFMGGGTTMMEANRVGCSVTGTDINPMAWWIVRQELQDLDVDAYQKAAEQLRAYLETEIGHLYRTVCVRCGRPTSRMAEPRLGPRGLAQVTSWLACRMSRSAFSIRSPGYVGPHKRLRPVSRIEPGFLLR